MPSVLVLSFLLGVAGVFGQESASGAGRKKGFAKVEVNVPGHPLVWETMTNRYSAMATEARHEFIFKVKNTGTNQVTIKGVQPSCGCTIARLPKTPWPLASGESGEFSAVVNFNEKTGTFSKTLNVESTAGDQVLTVEMTVPVTEASMHRAENREVSRTNRQAVLQGDCAKCHVAPATGKMGEELYLAACAICHESPHRASIVPALNDLNKRTYPAYWKFYIVNGGKGLMPAFAQEKGGFLTGAQIESLVPYLVKKFPSPTVIRPFSEK